VIAFSRRTPPRLLLFLGRLEARVVEAVVVKRAGADGVEH
jgi:hypothetical protein